MADIIYWNCQGYRSKNQELRLLLSELNPKCVCLQESMLGLNIIKSPKNYSIEQLLTPTTDAGTGLVTLVHKKIAYTRLNINTNLQVIAIQLKLSQLFTVCNIYINPDYPLNKRTIQDLINQLPEPYIIAGDFNCKSPIWGNNNSRNRNARAIEELLVDEVHLLDPGGPTHYDKRTNTTSTIDFALVPPEMATELESEVSDDLHGSDHFPVVINERNQNTNHIHTDPRYMYEKANWTKFASLTQIPDQTNDNTDINVMVSFLTDKIIRAAMVSIPKTSGRLPPNCAPWYDEECKRVRAEQRAALKMFQRHRSEAYKIELNRRVAIRKYTFRQKQKLSWQKYIDSINRETPCSKIWKKIGKMCGKYNQPHHPCLKVRGNTIAGSQEVAEALAAHFEQVSSADSYTPQFLRVKLQKELENLNFATNEHHSYNDPITLQEIIGALRQCKKTAPGRDEITYQMLENMHPSALLYLLNVFNRIWNQNCYPDLWKCAIVLAFPKPGKPRDNPSSYRPIALTSCLAKLLERIINIRLMNHLEHNSLVSPVQSGYRKARSTTDALVTLTSDIQDAFSRGEHLVATYFDMEKAYDRAWNHGIIKAMYTLGIRGNLASFVQNFLKDRKFVTKIGMEFSAERFQEEGVPQGSVLSCTLFVMAIDRIISQLPQHVKAILYVDDLVIYTTSRIVTLIQRRLQRAINQISNWCNNHGFSFALSKTHVVHFHRKREIQQPMQLTLNGLPIENASSKLYLGMIMDHRLEWREHIEKMRDSCIKRLNILRNISGKKWGSDRTTMFRLYHALVLPILDYGCEAYANAKKKYLSKLDTIHHTGIRLCTGAFRSSPTQSLYAESGELPLRIRREQRILLYALRTEQLPESMANKKTRNRQENLNTRYKTIGTRINLIRTETQLTRELVLPLRLHDFPIWNITPDTFCRGIENAPIKSNIQPSHLKSLFLDHISLVHTQDIPIYTDGSKTQDGVGSAAVFPNTRETLKLPTQATIFTAELTAIKMALKRAKDQIGNSFTIFSDSRSAVQAIQRLNNNHPLVVDIYEILIELTSDNKTIRFCWSPSHVGIHGNEVADTLAGEVANSHNAPSAIPLPFQDYIPNLKRAFRNKFQQEWTSTTNNKLREITNKVGAWNPAPKRSRRAEVILTRLRIGHTLYTHGHHMENRNRPYCEDCLVPLSIKHVLGECPSLNEARHRACSGKNNNDPVHNLKLLLEDNDDLAVTKLFTFLNEANILDRI